MTMVIHDLKNPTLSLKNGLDLMITKLKNSNTYKEYSQEMKKQQNKLNEKRTKKQKKMESMMSSHSIIENVDDCFSEIIKLIEK